MEPSSLLAFCDEWVRKAIHADAATAARRGDYSSAEAEIQAAPGLASWVDGLDLLARIRTQRGDLSSAAALWREASKIPGPSQERFSKAAAQAELWKSSRVGPDRLWFYVGGALSVVILLVVFALRVRDSRDLRPQATKPQEPPAVAGEPYGGSPAPAPKPAGQSNNLTDRLAQTGLVIRQTGPAVEVVFQRGLFRRRVEMSPEGTRIVRELSARMKPFASRVRVLVMGQTDRSTLLGDSPYSDNFELGLARAALVANMLRKGSDLLPDRLTVSSVGEADSSQSAERRKAEENRTVVIRITLDP